MDGKRLINSLVAERVMGMDLSTMSSMPVPCPDGIEGCCVAHYDMRFPTGLPLSDFAGNISSAWEVVRHLKSKGERLHLDDFNNRYCASFSNGVYDWKRNYEHASEAMAICGAALKVAGMTHDEIESAMKEAP